MRRVLAGEVMLAALVGVVALALTARAVGASPIWTVGAFALGVLILIHSLSRFGRTLDHLGLPNAITLFRAGLLALVAGASTIEDRDRSLIIGGAAYGAAVLLDLVDGFVARRFGSVSRAGADFDMRIDAYGLVLAPVVLVSLGRLPPIYLVLSFAFYLFRMALSVRRWLGMPVHEERLVPSAHSRMFAGAQMLLIFGAFFGPEGGLRRAVPLFMAPVLLGFVRDLGFASGWWRSDSDGYRRRVRPILWWTRRVVPTVLRLGVVLVFWLDPRIELGPRLGILLFAVSAGFVPRLAAIAAWWVLAGRSPEVEILLVGIVLLGGGALSLLPLEEPLLFGRLGGGHKLGRSAAGLAFAILGLSSLIWTAGQIEWGEVGLLFAGLPKDRILALIALNGLVLLVWSERGFRILRSHRGGGAIGRFTFLFSRLSSFAMSYLTPGPQAGGEILQVHLLTRRGMARDPAISAVLLDRLVELVANGTMILVLSTVALVRVPALRGEGPRVLWMVLPLGLAVGALAWISALARGRRPLGDRAQSRSWGDAIRRIEAVAGERLSAQRGLLRSSLIWSGLCWGLLLVEWRAHFWLLGVSVSPTEVLVSLGLARLAFLLPTPGGLGAFEASQWLAASALGYPTTIAAAMSLTMRARDLVQALIGLVFAGSEWPLRGDRGRSRPFAPTSNARGNAAEPPPPSGG